MNAVDTNVLIYSCDRRDPAKQSLARELIDSIQDGVLLWQVACEYIAATRKLSALGFSAQDAWDNLADLMVAFRLVVPEAAVLTSARRLHLAQRCSFWDAMIYAGCLEAQVSTIYSEDLPGSQIPGLNVVNPFAARSS